jgi:predicted nucleotidyltransferase
MVSFNDIYGRREEILRVTGSHGAHNVRVFGSVARGQSKETSDVDFLVTMDADRSLLDHIAIIRELEKLLGCHVDVVSDDALHHTIRDRVLAEGLPL